MKAGDNIHTSPYLEDCAIETAISKVIHSNSCFTHHLVNHHLHCNQGKKNNNHNKTYFPINYPNQVLRYKMTRVEPSIQVINWCYSLNEHRPGRSFQMLDVRC